MKKIIAICIASLFVACGDGGTNAPTPDAGTTDVSRDVPSDQSTLQDSSQPDVGADTGADMSAPIALDCPTLFANPIDRDAAYTQLDAAEATLVDPNATTAQRVEAGRAASAEISALMLSIPVVFDDACVMQDPEQTMEEVVLLIERRNAVVSEIAAALDGLTRTELTPYLSPDTVELVAEMDSEQVALIPTSLEIGQIVSDDLEYSSNLSADEFAVGILIMSHGGNFHLGDFTGNKAADYIFLTAINAIFGAEWEKFVRDPTIFNLIRTQLSGCINELIDIIERIAAGRGEASEIVDWITGCFKERMIKFITSDEFKTAVQIAASLSKTGLIKVGGKAIPVVGWIALGADIGATFWLRWPAIKSLIYADEPRCNTPLYKACTPHMGACTPSTNAMFRHTAGVCWDCIDCLHCGNAGIDPQIGEECDRANSTTSALPSDEQQGCADGSYCNDACKCVRCDTPPGPCYTTEGATFDEASGTCVYPPRPSGDSCDDNSVCTDPDECDGAGNCVGTVSVTCDMPPNSCYDDPGTCDPANGNCDYTQKAVNASCDDNDICTENDVCDAAATCAGTAITCPVISAQCRDGNNGSCVAGQGCVYPNLPAGSVCTDGDPCTVTDQCDAAGSCSGTVVSCATPPNDYCFEPTGVCDPNDGSCNYTASVVGTACDDDMDPCTVGTCDGSGNCNSTPLDQDMDGVCDLIDNCPAVFNPGQEDCDADLVGDICQTAMIGFPDLIDDFILPQQGGGPAPGGLPAMDMVDIVVDTNGQAPGVLTVTVTTQQNVQNVAPNFRSYDIVITVPNGGDPQPGLFNNGMFDLSWDGTSGTFNCQLYQFTNGPGWQPIALQPGFTCNVNANVLVFEIPIDALGIPYCDLGLSVFTQAIEDVNGDMVDEYIADWSVWQGNPIPF